MGARQDALIRRHAEIRTALKFFLDSWYKHKQVGSVPSPSQVLSDYIRYRSLEVVDNLKTKSRQVVQTLEKGPGQ